MIQSNVPKCINVNNGMNYLIVLVFIIFNAGCHDTGIDNDSDGGMLEGGNTNDDAGHESGIDKDSGQEVNDAGDSGTDAALCEEYIDENGHCVQDLGCYCQENSWECNGRRTYEEAQKYASELDLLSFMGVCLFQCEDGRHLLETYNDTDLGRYYYRKDTGELTGMYKDTDVPVYCNDSHWGKYMGDQKECNKICWEICRPPMLNPPACN